MNRLNSLLAAAALAAAAFSFNAYASDNHDGAACDGTGRGEACSPKCSCSQSCQGQQPNGRPSASEESSAKELKTEDIVAGYFHVIGGYKPGTSGCSLSQARAACRAVRFAYWLRANKADTAKLRDTLLRAWTGMSEAERKDFDTNFIDVCRLLDSCSADWPKMRGLFEDAGCSAAMDELMHNPDAQSAWSELKAHTLTMGNSDE